MAQDIEKMRQEIRDLQAEKQKGVSLRRRAYIDGRIECLRREILKIVQGKRDAA